MAELWSDRQKAAGRKLELNWWPKEKGGKNCWRKYKGKMLYFFTPNSKQGYEQALGQYHQKLSEIDGTKPYVSEYRRASTIIEQALTWYASHGEPDGEEGKADALRLIRDELADATPSEPVLVRVDALSEQAGLVKEPTLCLLDHNQTGESVESNGEAIRFAKVQRFQLADRWAERLRIPATTTQRKAAATIESAVKLLLEDKAAQARVNERAAGTLMDWNDKLKHFQTFIGKHTPCKKISEDTLRGYYNHLTRKVEARHIGKARAANLFKAVRSFITYCAENDLIEHLPKNIRSRRFEFNAAIGPNGKRVKTGATTADLWTPDEFHVALEHLSPRWQCYLLLILNCGFYESDLSSLFRSEVHFEKNGRGVIPTRCRIIRRRTKTIRRDSPPVINYKLWPITAKALHKQMHPTNDRLFTTRNGTPLKSEQINDDNTASCYNTMCRQWWRLRHEYKSTKGKFPDKKLMHLRHTGSSTIATKKDFIWVKTLYLGDAPIEIADRHYNPHDGQVYKPLDEALQYLGKQFRLL